MAALIEHETAPAEAGLIADADCRQGELRTLGHGLAGQHGTRGQQLLQGLQGVEEACRTRGLDAHLLGGYLQGVGFGAELAIEFEQQGGLSCLSLLALHASCGLQFLGKTVEHKAYAVAGIGIGVDIHLF